MTRELLGADHAGGLGRLRHVDRDEVALLEQLVEREQLHAELLGARARDVGVVGDDAHVERLQARGDERADAAEADDADGLLEQLGAGVRAALPLPAGERRVRGRDVAGEAQDVADGQLGGRDDVGGRRVDDHDAGGRRRLDVDVVEPDAGAGDDLEHAARPRSPRRRSSSPSGSARRARRRAPASSAGRSVPSTLRTSKSGPRASIVAGESSSAIRTTGFDTKADPSERGAQRRASEWMLRHTPSGRGTSPAYPARSRRSDRVTSADGHPLRQPEERRAGRPPRSATTLSQNTATTQSPSAARARTAHAGDASRRANASPKAISGNTTAKSRTNQP